MKTFRTLDLAKEYYQRSLNVKLSTHLKDQFHRSASSVALNLSEGNAKQSYKEKARFYEIAHGSFRESLIILDLEEVKDDELRKLAELLGAHLYKLTRAHWGKNSSENK